MPGQNTLAAVRLPPRLERNGVSLGHREPDVVSRDIGDYEVRTTINLVDRSDDTAVVCRLTTHGLGLECHTRRYTARMYERFGIDRNNV